MELASGGHALRIDIANCLRARRHEIEEATFARIGLITDENPVSDPEYIEGLRQSVVAAVDYGIASVELGQDGPSGIPPVLISQVRLAACSNISLDTVLRRYFAGFTLFGDHVLQEAEVALRTGRGTSLHRLLQAQTAQFDHLVATICDEYRRERERWIRSSDRRLGERVERLLYGELVDLSSLPVEFDSWHVGVVAKGPGVPDVLRKVAGDLSLRLFVVKPRHESIWGWMGSQEVPDKVEVQRALERSTPEGVAIAFGEAGKGLAGWRATHQQARACLPVAIKGGSRVVCYRDVGLIATLLQDELLTASLRRRYLHPLGGDEEGGHLRRTLRAYLDAERNVSSAAAALSLSRSTVNNRLRTIERRLGRPLGSCIMELEAAVQLEGLPPNRSAERDPPG